MDNLATWFFLRITVSSQIQDSAKITPDDAKVTGEPIRFTLPQFVVDYNDLLKITHSDG